MRKLVRCKACGFVTSEDKLADACPACGVPRRSFEDYVEPLSDRRSRILDVHLHPIIVHFAQAFSVFTMLLLVLVEITGGSLKADLLTTARVVLLFLPLTVAFAIPSGIIDGRTRFKKIRTELQLRKIAVGSLFLILSLPLAFIASDPGAMADKVELALVLIVGCVACSAILGMIGTSMLDAKLPG